MKCVIDERVPAEHTDNGVVLRPLWNDQDFTFSISKRSAMTTIKYVFYAAQIAGEEHRVLTAQISSVYLPKNFTVLTPIGYAGPPRRWRGGARRAHTCMCLPPWSAVHHRQSARLPGLVVCCITTTAWPAGARSPLDYYLLAKAYSKFAPVSQAVKHTINW